MTREVFVKIELVCDAQIACDGFYLTAFTARSLSEAMKEAREAGWKMVKDKVTCPDCADVPKPIAMENRK